ncbi:MAG: hypothetical protein E6G44_02030 [Actinobacteria bacterium]|nr:MAG: hypothetical protein E6G44_02030 [Actinomycetota bacterium]
MSPESILLSIRDRAGEGSYRFSCPTCMDMIEKPADRKVVALLLSAGVELAGEAGEEAEHAPEAPEHPESYRPGPPLTIDDLIAFHFLLQDDDAFLRALLSSGDG